MNTIDNLIATNHKHTIMDSNDHDTDITWNINVVVNANTMDSVFQFRNKR